MTGQRQPAGELTIGIVGPHDLVERIMLSGTAQAGGGPTAAPGHPAIAAPPPAANGSSPGPPRRLIAAAYRSEQEAADKVLRLGPSIAAAAWFASQVPYEYSRRAGSLRVPGTYVPLSGSALFAALLRASRELGRDLSRISVDVLSRADIEDAFSELGVPADNVHVREDVANAATLAAFHERLFRREEITVAFTCLQSVAERLAAADVPVRTLRPTTSAIRSALRTATLLAAAAGWKRRSSR